MQAQNELPCNQSRSDDSIWQVSLMDDSGNNRDDLTLPKGTSDAESLAKQLRDDFDAGKELVVTVLKVDFSSQNAVQSLQ